MEELQRRLEHPSSEARPSAAVLARWERGRAKYPAILLAPIQRSAWKGCSRKLAGRLQPTTDPRLVLQVLLPEGALQVTLLALYLITLDQQQH